MFEVAGGILLALLILCTPWWLVRWTLYFAFLIGTAMFIISCAPPYEEEQIKAWEQLEWSSCVDGDRQGKQRVLSENSYWERTYPDGEKKTIAKHRIVKRMGSCL